MRLTRKYALYLYFKAKVLGGCDIYYIEGEYKVCAYPCHITVFKGEDEKCRVAIIQTDPDCMAHFSLPNCKFIKLWGET